MMNTPLRFYRQCAIRMSLTMSESGPNPDIACPIRFQPATRNGLTIRRPSSSVMPCCMSSDHKVSQPA